MAERNKPHVTITRDPHAERYARPGLARGSNAPPSPSDRIQHGNKLIEQFSTAVSESHKRKESRGEVRVEGALNGIYVEFESQPGFELALTSLEPQQGNIHPELCAVTTKDIDGKPTQFATVFVPDNWVGKFIKRFDDYIYQNTSSGNPRNKKLVESINEIRQATLRALWTDDSDKFPDSDIAVWWELWLRRREGIAERLSSFVETAGIEVKHQQIAFEDRLVTLVQATPAQLGTALDLLDDIAELRHPVEAAQFLAELPASEQDEFVTELAGRLVAPPSGDAVTCLLDTGVAINHPLLRIAISQHDAHSIMPNWGSDDRQGHGTEMAGLVVHGDLAECFAVNGPIHVKGRLESVKILPNTGQNDPQSYGAITAQATSIVEINQPQRHRTFALAITATNTATHPSHLGEPSAWSSTIDALAAGRAISASNGDLIYIDKPASNAQRLFIVASGNVRGPYGEGHLERSDIEPVEDPGQAWNALTVGAYTNLYQIHHNDFKDWKPLARTGELSPFSRTSVGFRDQWPHKPEIVLEGGNAAISPSNQSIDTPPDLQVLTTCSPALGGRLLTTAAGTSPATAQAAHLAQQLSTKYPHLWPETIRGMIVHSARWTETMKRHFTGANRRSTLAKLRRYGWGVPDTSRALSSANDSVTLISQNLIHPYSDGKMREMHLHNLPWPTDVLSELGDETVEMRVVLSYFIEPNPARRGWAQRFRYASHALRFDVRRRTETSDDFRKRVNKLALAESEKPSTSESDSNQWLLGPKERVRGSLHVDHWTGPAVELAARGAIAVYPITGWWKERKSRDRSEDGVRYALIVSIESPEIEVDMWTPVAIQAEVPLVIET